jgi:ribosomal protein S18 acetylase RimI-like enzyme
VLIRAIEETDYAAVIAKLDDWWGGRHMADMLPRLFFKHFRQTSFIAEDSGQILGFLVGLISQSCPEKAYIHFVGIHPAHRGKGLGRTLYNRFYETVTAMGCHSVHLVTAPVNKNSIAYHRKLGFAMGKSDTCIDGVWVHAGYDGPGEDRVVFYKEI